MKCSAIFARANLILTTNQPAFTQFVIPSEVEGSQELRLGGHEWTQICRAFAAGIGSSAVASAKAGDAGGWNVL
jgi:hypothetical protein